jgi:Asp-tRNA(Asn)/Glu-tRNA(Gln) amidotransferase C subunit
MENHIRKLNQTYGFALSEEEIQLIAQRAEEFDKLFQCLYEVDLTGMAPLLKFDRKTL